jgi:bacterioferritin-associated ferredoxin
MYLCLCKGINDTEVRRVGQAGCLTPEEIIAALGLRDEECCGNCIENIEEFVAVAESGVEEEKPDPFYSVAT